MNTRSNAFFSALDREPARIVILVAVFAATLVIGVGSIQADSRKGFVLGGGIGPGIVRLASDGKSEFHLGLSTDLTVGYGLSDQLVGFAMSRIVWFSESDALTFSESTGLGLSYFASNTAPSLFVTGGLGAAVFVKPGEDSENQFGPAGVVGVGYEASSHWLFEVSLSYGSPGDLSATGLMAKLNYYAY